MALGLVQLAATSGSILSVDPRSDPRFDGSVDTLHVPEGVEVFAMAVVPVRASVATPSDGSAQEPNRVVCGVLKVGVGLCMSAVC